MKDYQREAIADGRAINTKNAEELRELLKPHFNFFIPFWGQDGIDNEISSWVKLIQESGEVAYKTDIRMSLMNVLSEQKFETLNIVFDYKLKEAEAKIDKLVKRYERKLKGGK